jgi:hypothetical protein
MSVFKQLSVFNRITFVEKSHTYLIDGTATNCVSVTGVIKKFKPIFNVEEAANRVAKRLNVSVQDVRNDWEINNQLSTTLGSIVHKYIENFYSNKKIPIEQTLISNVLGKYEKHILLQKIPKLISYFHEFHNDFIHLIGAKTEFVIGDINNTKICGMVDLLCYNEKTDTFEIIDFKTNKKIKTASAYKTKMISPFNDLPDCELAHYTIQLNTYRYIIEKYTNLKITGLKIVWLNSDNETYKIFELDDIQPKIKEAFQLLSSTLKT